MYRIFFGALLVPFFVAACSDSDGVRITGTGSDPDVTLGQHTSHTGPADGVWPPQPANMTNAQPYPASARQGALSGVLMAARSAVLNNPEVRASLGNDYREIDSSLGAHKSDEVAGFVFYNYATDETLDISLQSDGSVDNEIFPASVFQPSEHPQEQADAIDLARIELTNSSFDVTGLQATAMLAFPAESEIQSIEQHFYPQRVLYVTFGPGQGEMPVYAALVDLSGATVLEHGLVK